MTKRLYHIDSHMREAFATVRSCTAAEGGFAAVLDQTVFFPTGGGQPCDLGTIDGVAVLDCRERDGEVVHRVDGELPVGKTVALNINWARRFDFMQQHTGEHLLSFAAYKLFAAANIGFHLAETYTTIDFNKPLTHEQLVEAEALANAYVWRNLAVLTTLYETEADIAALPLRKHAEGLTAPIRVVQVEGADCCTCCAPHCARTGEVGMVLITDAAAYKGGTRVTFLCGQRASVHARTVHDTLERLARSFSTARDNAEAAVKKQGELLNAAKCSERELTRALNGYVAAELKGTQETVGGHRLIVALLENTDAVRLKDLAQQTAVGDALTVLLSRYDGKLLYVVACGEAFSLGVSEPVQAVNAATGGKGGGRGTLAQGMSVATDGLTETVEQLHRYFRQRLKG